MKELSIEEKAKRYDEAIKYAHYLINERCKEGTDGSFHRADLNKMFHELKESEDERIRKGIIEYLRQRLDRSPSIPAAIGSWIAWLEKQGEPKPALAKVGEDGSMDKSWHPEKQSEQKASYTNIVETGNGGINALVTRELPTDGEQKPVEVKPFNKVFSQEEINLIDKRIEEMQRIHDAELRDKQKNAKDFPMTD